MFQLYRKNKTAILLTLLILMGTAALVVCGIIFSKDTGIKFHTDGYLLDVVVDETNLAVPSRVSFLEGTSVREGLEENYEFADENGTYVKCAAKDFFYYADSSISSLEGMLLVDLEQFAQGIMDHYYIASMMVLQRDGDSFIIDNNQTDLLFTNFLLKTGPMTYVVASPKMRLSLGSGAPIELSGNVAQLTYTDELGTVFSLTDGEGAWQYFSRGCTLTLENGAVLELGDMLMHDQKKDKDTGLFKNQIVLGDLEVSAASAISVASATDKVWKPLKFILTADHGEEGAKGTEGIDGEVGEDGLEGEEGRTGHSAGIGATGGSKGEGSAGAGGRPGAPGSSLAGDSESSDTEPPYAPYVNILSWSQTAGSLTVTAQSYYTKPATPSANAYTVLENTTEAYILELKTGRKIPWVGLDIAADGGDEGFTYTFNGLLPNYDYRLVINAKMRKGTSEDKIAKTNFISRDFSTDNLGFFVEKIASAYITGEDLSAGGYGEDAVEGAALGLHATISGSQTIASIENAVIKFSDGTPDRALTDKEVEALLNSQKDNSTCWIYGLPSDTNCSFQMTVTVPGKTPEDVSITYLTLKKTPSAYGVSFDVNENRYFVSMITIKDDDQAIVSYTHEVYPYNDSTGELDEYRCLKSKTTTTPNTNIYQDGNITTGGTLYANRVYVTWFDNEKYVTKEGKRSESWGGKFLSESSQPHISVIEADDSGGGIGTNTARIKLKIHPGGDNKVYLGEYRLLAQITAANFTSTKYFDSVAGWTDQNGNQIEDETGFSQETCSPVIELKGLEPDTGYIVTVMAYLGPLNSPNTKPTQQTVGTTTFQTQAGTTSDESTEGETSIETESEEIVTEGEGNA